MRLLVSIIQAMTVAFISGCVSPDDTKATSVHITSDEKHVQNNPLRSAYFGDFHVHTNQSFDAFIMGAREDADAAYRFAKGEPISHPSGRTMQLSKPLDFQMVSDHGVYLGMLPAMMQPSSSVSGHPLAEEMRTAEQPHERAQAFGKIVPRIVDYTGEDDLLDEEIVRSAWQSNIEAAARHNEPGEFTTFIGYEYTSTGPEFENLHRNVVFSGEKIPNMPFTRLDSTNPEDLWTWMDNLRYLGIDSLAIPHNSNGSNGWMFKETKWDNKPIDARYAAQRMRNEPIVENTQVKGTSDTHPSLSPNDEWADFEIMPNRVASPLASVAPGSYVRDAYNRGLIIEREIGQNPFKFGVVGSSDSHVSAGSFEENNYWAKIGMMDATAEQRGSIPDANLQDTKGAATYRETINLTYGASGLAGIWAEENTRASLFSALKRKETFSTSGTRIALRIFGGFDIDPQLSTRENRLELAYAQGVPMGSDLASGSGKPKFFLWAMQDPDSAPLQRLQIIKGSLRDGILVETVFDAACAQGMEVDRATNRCPTMDAEVNLEDCSFDYSIGSPELATVWTDPDFQPGEMAFYYLRALENPTCRWSTWDAIRSGTKPNPFVPATIQERAWSSPIWYSPTQTAT